MFKEDPNKTIATNIKAHGWHCLHVFSNDEQEENFTYSIGFAQSFDAPEILIFGIPLEKSRALLNACAESLKRGHQFSPNVADGTILQGGYKVVFKPLLKEHFDEYVGAALRYYYPTPFHAMVMFLPDRHHAFPWESALQARILLNRYSSYKRAMGSTPFPRTRR